MFNSAGFSNARRQSVDTAPSNLRTECITQENKNTSRDLLRRNVFEKHITHNYHYYAPRENRFPSPRHTRRLRNENSNNIIISFIRLKFPSTYIYTIGVWRQNTIRQGTGGNHQKSRRGLGRETVHFSRAFQASASSYIPIYTFYFYYLYYYNIIINIVCGSESNILTNRCRIRIIIFG